MFALTNAKADPIRRYRLGFWAVAFAFAAVMAFTTVPTPLWSLFAQRDHFSSLTITVAFAVYAVAVALSLFLAGHLSDVYGRRRVLVPALALNVGAGAVFIAWPALPGLLVARVLSGVGVGAVTATAMVWLAELDAARRPRAHASSRRAQIIGTVANLGGLGLGGLIAGALAQWVGHALTLPFLALAGAVLAGLLAVTAAPETRMPVSPRPRYRPQRVSVPPRSRGRFFAAATGAAITFAIFGLITSLAPSFLAGALHQPSHALAGAISFAMFAAAALAQTLTGTRSPRQLLGAAIPTLLTGLGLLTLAVWVPSPSFGIFLAGDLVAGVGAGLMFRGAIGTVAEISLPERRAEAVAGFFLACYVGLAGPVIGLGVLTQLASTRVSLLAFAGLLALGIVTAAPRLLAGRPALCRPSTSLRLKGVTVPTTQLKTTQLGRTGLEITLKRDSILREAHASLERLVAELKEQGLVRHIGVSNFDVEQLSRNLDLVERIGVVADRHGTASGAVAIAWTLGNPAVDGAIVGFRSPEQVDPLIDAANLELSAEDIATIEGVQ